MGSDAAGITRRRPVAGAEGHPGRFGLLLGVLYGPVTFGMLAAAVAVPHAQGFGDPASAAWLLSAYAIALGVGTAVFGPLAERWGTLACLRLGSALMLAGTAVCLLSSAPGLLLAGRVALALGSASVITVVLTIAAHVDAPRRQATSAALGAVMATFLSVATLAGGFATAVLGWRGALVLPVLSVLVVPWMARHHHRAGHSEAQFDGVGAGLLVVFAACTLGLTQVALVPAEATFMLIGGAAVAGVTQWIRAGRSDAFIPARLMRERQFRRTCLLASGVYGTQFSVVLIASQTLAGEGWTPVSTGLVLVPCAAVGVAAAHGITPTRHNPSAALQTGIGAVAVVGVVVPGLAGWFEAVVLAAVSSVAVFALGQPLITVSLATLPTDRRATAVGLTYFAAFAGGATGTAVAAMLLPALGLGHALAAVALAALALTFVSRPNRLLSRGISPTSPGDAAGITPQRKDVR